ncbi:MAG: hypothetical protein NXI14_08865 [bacterium]|nr:hypothetical protein [bacterium]
MATTEKNPEESAASKRGSNTCERVLGDRVFCFVRGFAPELGAAFGGVMCSGLDAVGRRFHAPFSCADRFANHAPKVLAYHREVLSQLGDFGAEFRFGLRIIYCGSISHCVISFVKIGEFQTKEACGRVLSTE